MKHTQQSKEMKKISRSYNIRHKTFQDNISITNWIRLIPRGDSWWLVTHLASLHRYCRVPPVLSPAPPSPLLPSLITPNPPRIPRKYRGNTLDSRTVSPCVLALLPTTVDGLLVCPQYTCQWSYGLPRIRDSNEVQTWVVELITKGAYSRVGTICWKAKM